MKYWSIFGLLVFAYAALLFARVVFTLNAEAAETLPLYDGHTGAVVGRVVNDPDRRATSLHVHVRVATVDGEPARGTLLALLPPQAEVSYGDTVEVSGTIKTPEPFETDTGREFNYAGYLRVQGVSMMMQKATLQNVEEGGLSLQKTLFSIKHTFEHSLEKLFPEPDNSLLEGILLGERSGLPKDVQNAFIASSLVHVVVLSGYNISIVANAVLYATSGLPRTFSYGFGGMLMILFAMMTGAGATTVRACAMGVISIVAQYMHRPTVAMRSLIAAAGAMILWNPLIVLYDSSFILSVLATFGLVTLSPTTERWVRWIPEKFGLRSIAAATIAVQLFVLPALLYFTGVLSVVALPANLLALPVVSWAMLFGFIAGLLGFVHPALALPFAILGDALLRWMMLVANTATAFPFSSTVVAAFPAWILIAMYIPLTTIATKIYLTQSNS
ncbi:MAG TPA: ComEC/Rec2 family competence protein [Candidatus Paceibacterota bacterium]|nr:ComEC/Rec2 family competence protein [Candidatus Paceibacterota bacterium]